MDRIIDLLENTTFNQNELEFIRDNIDKKIKKLTIEVEKTYMIPKIFRDCVLSIHFDCNYDTDKDPGFDTYNDIYCNTTINFNKFKICCTYSINAKNDWNSSNVKLSIMKKYKNKGKKYWKEFIIKYQYNETNREIIININALTALDYLNLEKNTFNKTMLGILINNIIAMTKEKCANGRDNQEIFIDCNALEDSQNVIIKYDD